jgi:glycosyltransferase involved in cell wall biosynthesis
MIYLAFPLGTVHGWGVCGRMITRELANLTPVEFYTQQFHASLVADAFEERLLLSLMPPGIDPANPPEGHAVDAPVLRGIPSMTVSFRPALRGTFNVGYTFFESDVPAEGTIFGEFDHVVAGSTWCADRLRAAGLKSVSAILQGVDPRYFNTHLNEKPFLRDRFVIFSGGKLEFRKGQDLVIAAFRVLQQRHKDVLLVNAWNNPWSWSANTIAASPHIKVPALSGDYAQVINQLLAHNGIDVADVISLGPRPNALMAEVYKNTDIGVFPNRCEGGTNLVLCEYMACGKPAIASFNTGHCDIINDENAIPVRSMKPFEVRDEKQTHLGHWYEPSLDELIEKLEWAYQNRDALEPLADRAAEDLAKLTWSDTARRFYELLTRPS